MKRFLALIAAIIMIFALGACAAKDCELCGAKGEGKNKVEIGGESGYVCDSCEEGVEALAALAALA